MQSGTGIALSAAVAQPSRSACISRIRPLFSSAFQNSPESCSRSAGGLGAGQFQLYNGSRLAANGNVVVVNITYRIGVFGGILLGLGRALGETMAVTFVIGNSHHIHASILQPGTTISAALANEFTEAVGDLYLSSLIALGLILFVITFIVLALAKLLLIRLERQAGKVT